ncbi:MAG TPA: choice-of-anchor D domain-containing protein, partial [Candidatus Angelobacter sp.]|nr:choice-of-anchor D domain-containing protein [Candidatus Angelobacter sp.]
AAAAAGDTIQIDSSVTYVGDVCAWTTPDLTLQGVGGARAHIDAGGLNSQGKAIWVISGANTTVENIEFSGATVPDHNGAGIRQQADNLTVRNCYFHDNEEGILTDASLTSTITIEFTEFGFNGFGDGQSHNVYIGNIGTLIFRYNYSHHAKIGHLLKTRAAQNFILYNRLSDEATGTSSYQIDIPNGGLSYVIGNVIEQGPLNDNSTFIAYLEEGINPGNPNEQLFVINNTFANDASSGTFISLAPGAAPVVIKNNIFSGPGTITNQASAVQANNFSGNAAFVNSAGYDYHLTSGSAAINAGADPGSNATFSLSPVFQYVHPACAEGRTLVGTIDIGAYEFNGGTGIAPANGTCSTATGPLVTLSSSSLVFASQQISTTSLGQALTITNTGNASLSISDIAASGDFTQTNNCSTVAAGAGCTITVKFVPTVVGKRTGTITITDSAPGSPHSVSLTGTGSSAPTSDFSVTATSGSATISAGQTASFTLNLAASGGFNQTVGLTCSGAPTSSTCTVSPSSVSMASGSGTAQVSFQTTARAAVVPTSTSKMENPLRSEWLVLSLVIIILLLLLARQKGFTRLRFVAVPALLLALGCGSTGSKSSPTQTGVGTPAGTYNLTVTGTAGPQTHTTNLTVVVN